MHEEDQHGTPVDGQDPQLRNYDLVPDYPTNEQGLSHDQSTPTTAKKYDVPYFVNYVYKC